MAISTINGKLALMEMDVWEPAIPIVDTGTLGQDDRQQFVWGFPEVLWGELSDLGNAILDLNTRLYVFLNSFYGFSPTKELQPLLSKYLAEEKTGDYNNRWLAMIDDATVG